MGRLDAALEYAKAQPRFFVYAISMPDGSPVYVGSTKHPERRHLQHCDTSSPWQRELRTWIAANQHVFEVLDTFPSKRMMLSAETEYIRELRPRFNLKPHA